MEGKKSTYLLAGFGVSGWIACIVVLLFLHYCGKTELPEVSSKTVINNYYDSSQKAIPAINIPAPITFTVPVPVNVDTAKILEQYFAKNYYTQTIEDSCIRATIKDTIGENKLLHRAFKYQWLKPIKTVESTTVTVTTPEPKPLVRLYVGGFLNVNKSYIQGFGPEIYFTTRSNLLLKANYDIRNNCFGIGGGINPVYKNARNRDKAKPQ